MFERSDWTIFRNLNTITHKAGVPLNQLRQLVLKELVDNALDANPGTKCKLEKIDKDTFKITDSGAGIPGTPEQIASLFSINRPLTSSKIVRLPTRGAMGNGLRVVSGTVLASGGHLTVETRGKRYNLNLKDDGNTTVAKTANSDVTGTAVTITFGKTVPSNGRELAWATLANLFSFAKTYKGKTSAWWYDSDSFYELMMAAGARPLKELLEYFDVTSSAVQKSKLNVDSGEPCNSFGRDAAEIVLGELLSLNLKQISPQQIGRAYDTIPTDIAYHREFGTLNLPPGRGHFTALLPFCVEAWAVPREVEDEDDLLLAFVNGTPVVGEMTIDRRGKGEVALHGCGLHHRIDRCSARKFVLTLNVTIPYVPITTDGKEPDFTKFLSEIVTVTRRATRKLKAIKHKSGEQSFIIVDNLDTAIAKASGNGQLRYSLRQLYYAIRPYVMESTGGELNYNHFCRVISKHEAAEGELAGIYRDPRGVIYQPHVHTTTPVGTISVEGFERQAWLFNKVIYCEKEGLFEVLKQARFPDRYDCVLLSSKGFASRAVKDLLDLIGEMDEETHFYCIHDADGPGTLIYETLVGSTIARAARKVKIHNLGLDPWEAVAMNLQIETFPTRKSRTPVARYIRDHEEENDQDKGGDEWDRWLQNNRIELNAMTSPAFLAWTEAKMKAFGVAKVIPPRDIMMAQVTKDADELVRERIREQILRDNGFEAKVTKAMNEVKKKVERADLLLAVKTAFDWDDSQQWKAPLRQEAEAFSKPGKTKTRKTKK